jgi:uncharacterized protein (DUF1330 family)
LAAYVIVDIDIHDSETYGEYRRLAPASVAAYGGRYLARGGRTDVLEGNWSPHRLVILEFPDMDRAKEWLDCSDYAPVKALRHKSAHSNMVVIEGVEPGLVPKH